MSSLEEAVGRLHDLLEAGAIRGEGRREGEERIGKKNREGQGD